MKELVSDVMVVTLARQIDDRDVIGVGLGTPLAVAAALFAQATHAPAADVLIGGVVNPVADLRTCLEGPAGLTNRTAGYVPHLDTMDMAERQTMTLQFLRPAQIDGEGNLNTSRIGPRQRPTVRFPGGLATGDVPMLLPRIVAYLPNHCRRNLPSQVAVVTGAGCGWHGNDYQTLGVVTLVTDLAVITFTRQGATLQSVHPGVDPDDVVSETCFDLQIPPVIPQTPRVTDADRVALNHIDATNRRADEIRPSSGSRGSVAGEQT